MAIGFGEWAECYVRGNTIKYVCVPDEVLGRGEGRDEESSAGRRSRRGRVEAVAAVAAGRGRGGRGRGEVSARGSPSGRRGDASEIAHVVCHTSYFSHAFARALPSRVFRRRSSASRVRTGSNRRGAASRFARAPRV